MSSTSHTILIMLFCLLASLSALPALAYDNAYCSMKQVSTDPQRTARTETSGTKFIIYCEDKNNADVIVQTITHTCMYNAIGKNNIAITPNYSCSNIGGKSLTVSE